MGKNKAGIPSEALNGGEVMNLTFRPSEESDIEELRIWLRDPDVLRYFPMTDAKECDDAIRNWISYRKMKAAVTVLLDGKPVGMSNLYIQFFEKLKHQTLLSIVVAPGMRGQGIGTQLLEYMKKYAQEAFQIEVLHLEVYDGNPAQRLYERAGFVVYGRHPAFIKEADGTYVDKICMELDFGRA
jgi:RimJ/RimL family protein N-acetyltransferase